MQSQVKDSKGTQNRSSCPAKRSRSVCVFKQDRYQSQACNSRRYLSRTLRFRLLPAHQLALRSQLCNAEPFTAVLLMPFLIRYWVFVHHVVGQQHLKLCTLPHGASLHIARLSLQSGLQTCKPASISSADLLMAFPLHEKDLNAMGPASSLGLMVKPGFQVYHWTGIAILPKGWFVCAVT